MQRTILNNRYRVLKALSSGGFGETFIAQDTHLPSGRLCVIKQLKPVSDDAQTHQLVQERFRREAAVLERLSKSNCQIPQLYAYFNESGNFYLVQEWVEGKTVAELVQQAGTLKESSVVQILTSLLVVLAQIHEEGIIHRDIKPENIIICSSDHQPVLIDFGAVKETMHSVSFKSSKSSIVIGTSGFMPPEQSVGRPVLASDLYSLGLTAVYMLTGKLPQELETDLQTGQIEWHSYCLSISQSLIAVINRSITLHSVNRYSTANEMLADLRPLWFTNSAEAKATGVTKALATNGKKQTAKVTIISEPTKDKLARLRQLIDWSKMIFVSGILVSLPIVLLSGLSSRNTQTRQHASTKVESTSSLVNTTKQENVKKLIATKACIKCDLSGTNLANIDLSRARLMYADLSRANLAGSDLSMADLSNSNLEQANFKKANLTRANLGKTILKSANLSDSNLSQAYLLAASLKNASLANANLNRARLNSADLSGANLTSASLKSSYLSHSTFSGSQLVNTDFTDAKFCSFKQSNCADFTNAYLEGFTRSSGKNTNTFLTER